MCSISFGYYNFYQKNNNEQFIDNFLSINLHTTSKHVSDFSIMPPRKSNLNNACSKDKLCMRVKRPHESEEQIAARNSRLYARLALIKEGRPVKIFTDNSVKTIVFGNTEMNNDSLNAVYIQVE
jgi:hypothetical protein